MRTCGVLLKVEDQDRNGLDRMARRLQDLEPHPRKIQAVAVLHGDEWVLRVRAGAEMNGGAAAITELQMPGNEVGMKMRQEYVPDMQAKIRGVVQVLLDISLRIDNHGR